MVQENLMMRIYPPAKSTFPGAETAIGCLEVKIVIHAFAPFSGRKAEKLARDKQELDQKKLHVLLVDRTPTEPPPVIVAVVGPLQ
ncbi:16987_t:CDS:2, partial [Funneliformis caledonium]